jgi:hypothetical protein
MADYHFANRDDLIQLLEEEMNLNGRFQARIEELKRALENLCIHVGMGWETDEMLEKARAVLEKKP